MNQRPKYLRHHEVLILMQRFHPLLSEMTWYHLIKYSIAGYSQRGHRKYHNMMVRKLYRAIITASREAKTKEAFVILPEDSLFRAALALGASGHQGLAEELLLTHIPQG